MAPNSVGAGCSQLLSDMQAFKASIMHLAGLTLVIFKVWSFFYFISIKAKGFYSRQPILVVC